MGGCRPGAWKSENGEFSPSTKRDHSLEKTNVMRSPLGIVRILSQPAVDVLLCNLDGSMTGWDHVAVGKHIAAGYLELTWRHIALGLCDDDGRSSKRAALAPNSFFCRARFIKKLKMHSNN